MKRLVTMALIVLALVVCSAQFLTPVVRAAGGSCSCPKTTPVCCLNCNGTFAFCARSHAFCPECPAP
jgi:hypothetical protein